MTYQSLHCKEHNVWYLIHRVERGRQNAVSMVLPGSNPVDLYNTQYLHLGTVLKLASIIR